MKVARNVFEGLNQLGHRMTTAMERLLRVNTYAFRDGKIVRNRGLRMPEQLVLADVAEWCIYPEMGFDIVSIKLLTGMTVQWIDKYDDLITILRSHAGKAESR